MASDPADKQAKPDQSRAHTGSDWRQIKPEPMVGYRLRSAVR